MDAASLLRLADRTAARCALPGRVGCERDDLRSEGVLARLRGASVEAGIADALRQHGPRTRAGHARPLTFRLSHPLPLLQRRGICRGAGPIGRDWTLHDVLATPEPEEPGPSADEILAAVGRLPRAEREVTRARIAGRLLREIGAAHGRTEAWASLALRSARAMLRPTLVPLLTLLCAAPQAQPVGYSLLVETRRWAFDADTLQSAPTGVLSFDSEARALAAEAFAAACLPPPQPAPNPPVPTDDRLVYELAAFEVGPTFALAEASVGTLGPPVAGTRRTVWDTLRTARSSSTDPAPRPGRADLLRTAAQAITADVLTRFGEPPPAPGAFAIYPTVTCTDRLVAQVPPGWSVAWYDVAGRRIGAGPTLTSAVPGPKYAVATNDATRVREVRRGHVVRQPLRLPRPSGARR
ncbi:MAG TPA: hypothetical protein VD838_16375 [Anaeromyxobacteraceae bacterium]|nr:hypothetical protein [Anaeromyxobacteraceae bacterium]